MYTTEFITDVLTEEVAREADYFGKTVSIAPKAIAQAVKRIESAFNKFAPSSLWSYEDQEQANSDALVTLIDREVAKLVR